MNEYLDFAKELAAEAGKIMSQYFESESQDTSWKEDNTPLTIADTTINKLVIERVKAKFPNHGILGEEDAYEAERDSLWVVDPIDGTVPFTLGIPISTFSIAFVKKGTPQVAVIYDPFSKKMFSALVGGGSYLNDKKINVSDTKTLARNSITMPARDIDGRTEIGHFFNKATKARVLSFNLWSFSYCSTLVANGRMAAAVYGNRSPWDGAAVKVIVEEAGGHTSDLDGNPQLYNGKINGMIVSNGFVHDQMIELMKND